MLLKGLTVLSAEKKKEEKVEVQAKYVPVKPIDPNDVTTNEYLFDTNSLLTTIEQDLRLIIQILASKEENQNKPGVKTIGIR